MCCIKKTTLSLHLISTVFPFSAFGQTLNIPSGTNQETTFDLQKYYPDGVNLEGPSSTLKILQSVSGKYAPIGGGIFGRGSVVIDTSSNAIVILSGTPPSYSGFIQIIGASTLQGDVSPNSLLQLSSSQATYILDGTDQAALSLQGQGGSTINLGSNTLTIGQDSKGAIGKFDGVIQDGNSSGGDGVGNLQLLFGELTLGGNNTYTGTTTITGNDSSLIGTTESFPPPTPGITSSGSIINNGALTFNQSFDGTFEGNISGSGFVSINGEGTITYEGTNTYTGGTIVNNGVLQGPLTTNTPLNVNSGTYALTEPQTISILSGPEKGTVALEANTLTVNENTATEFAGQITGTGSLVMAGGGTLILSGNNTYSGGTTLDGGTVIINSSTGLGSGSLTFNNGATLDATNVTVSQDITLNASGGTFDVQPGLTTTLSGNIGGSGALILSGGGSLFPIGKNTYSGGTTLNNGTLAIESDDSLGSGPITLIGNANFGTIDVSKGTINLSQPITLNGGGGFNVGSGVTLELSGGITGPGPVITSGPGTLSLKGEVKYDAGTIVNAGTLQGSIPESTALEVNGGTFSFSLPYNFLREERRD
ncbi:MAG: autotransporter-associated beta strand repeat-containing protein [Alphaproteobacteria bacterium]|nr:autotransporter-associated beta strand repeat-containing protein [Alphaproteobacteria bacterium]